MQARADSQAVECQSAAVHCYDRGAMVPPRWPDGQGRLIPTYPCPRCGREVAVRFRASAWSTCDTSAGSSSPRRRTGTGADTVATGVAIDADDRSYLATTRHFAESIKDRATYEAFERRGVTYAIRLAAGIEDLLARLRGRLSHTPPVRYRSSQYRAARLAGRWRAPRESPDPLLNLNAIRNAFASNRGDTLASRRGDVVPRL